MELIGYVMVGVLIACIGTIGILWIDVGTFFVSAVIIATIHAKEKIEAKSEKNSVLVDFREGLKFVGSNGILKILLAIGILINFGIMPLTVFQTPYVSDYLKLGPAMLSVIKISMVIGMGIGSAIVPKWKKESRNSMVTGAGVLMGLSLVIMFFAPGINLFSLKVVFVCFSMLMVGFGGGILNIIVGSNMLKYVPQSMMGRVGGLINAIMVISMPIASFLCSFLAVTMSVTQILFVFGVFMIAVYVWMAIRGHFMEL